MYAMNIVFFFSECLQLWLSQTSGRLRCVAPLNSTNKIFVLCTFSLEIMNIVELADAHEL